MEKKLTQSTAGHAPEHRPVPQDAAARAEEILRELQGYATPEKRDFLPRFFKTGKGQYGEGDRFLGVVVPHTRQVAKRHKDEPAETAARLLQSPWHECRLCALLMLVERFKRADEATRERICAFYLHHTQRINNWDLVDLSAPYIVGEYLADKPRDVLRRLAESPSLWEQRIAVVSTLTLIRRGELDDTFQLADYFIAHRQPMHDLMQKAIGWVLREAGKRDKQALTDFLHGHLAAMPRTMLRYAIERFPDDERRHFMKR